MPSSPGATSDDKMHKSLDHYQGKMIVITEKMDGENTTMYSDYIHARSIDGQSHPSRDWVKQFHGSISHMIPPNMRICGENMFARHSISYNDLESYFYGFSAWEGDTCLSWDDTVTYFELLGITPVRVLWRGLYNPETLCNIVNSIDTNVVEGMVVRNENAFKLDEFSENACKWVRSNHVQTESHWMHSQIIPNTLRKDT